MTIPIGTPRTRDELIPITIIPSARARYATSTIRGVIVRESAITKEALLAVRTLAIIIQANVGLKYVAILPRKKINKVARYNFFRSYFPVTDNKIGPLIA